MEILSRYVAQLVATRSIYRKNRTLSTLRQISLTEMDNALVQFLIARDEITNFFPLFSASPRICFGYKHGQEYSTVSYIYTHYIAC